MNNDMIDFINKFHPEIVDEYNRYINRNNLPKVGDIVYPINGNSGYGGSDYLNVLKFVKKGDMEGDAIWGDDYIVMGGYNGTFLCQPEDFWKKFHEVKGI